jgi:hypothetical protein
MSICNEEIIKKPYNESFILETLRRDYGLSNINNVIGGFDVCAEIFNGPTYTTNLNKVITGLTEDSIGVFNLSELDEGSFDIEYTFTGNQETLTAYTGNLISRVYRRRGIQELDSVNIKPNQSIPEATTFSFAVIQSDIVKFSAITASGYSYSISTNLENTDEEYILNTNYRFTTKDCSPGLVVTNPSIGNRYDESSSWYFVTLVNPETPELGPFPEPEPLSPEILTVVRRERPLGDETYVFGVPQKTDVSNKCKLITENLAINSPSSTIFSISTIPEPNSMLISVNGITLGTDDYSISGETIITLTQPLYPGKDIITATYIDCDFETSIVYSEQYEITSGVTSGATSGYTTEKVYYNTDQSKYEYYLDFEPDDAENVMLFLNGVKLTYGLDYVLSTSVDNRIIFIGVTLGVSDIIFAAYFSGQSIEGDYGLVETQGSTLQWRVNNPIVVNSRVDGEFLVEVTESTDKTFSSTATTKQVTVDYIEGETLFSTPIPEGLSENKKYIWRVTSKKVYSGLLGNIFNTESVSRVGKFYTKILPY